MAIPNSWSASSLSSTENIPQLTKPSLPPTTSTNPTTNKKNITAATEFKPIPDPSKQKESHIEEITYFTVEDQTQLKHALKLKEVRHLLSQVVNDNPFEGLVMVDALQRLGLDYHFKEEISSTLKSNYDQVINTHVDEHQDLYEVSLRFRILRQQGYNVPSDVFETFKSENGKFDAKLRQDMKGLMALYEASQLSIKGEDILEEAANFSSHLLKEMVPFLDHDQGRTVRDALEHPHQKSSSRFMLKNYIKDFNSTMLQELAEMDFNMVQSMHRRELQKVSRWWKDLGLAKELKFARDQPVKWYIWPMAALTDPSLSEQRIDLTKPISLIYIIDDIFDVYGTLDELTFFTEAVNRWDIDAIEHLPHYMKICFKALYDITNEISNKVYKQHGFNPVGYLHKSWATLCDAFLVEAKWFASGHQPKAEEYLKNGIVSSGADVVLVHMFFLLGEGTNKESASLTDDNKGIIFSVAKLLRLWDDLGCAQDENQDGHDGSYVACYINEHQASSIQTARQHVIGLILDTWKDLNKECLSPSPFSAAFREATLNTARMISLMYSYDDNHSLPLLEDYIKSMLYENISL